MLRLFVVQEYVPEYRVAFFQSLDSELLKLGVELRVLAGSPSGVQADRADWADASDHHWLHYTPVRFRAQRGPQFQFQNAMSQMRRGDYAVMPLAATNLDALMASLVSMKRRVALWGHVGAYVRMSNPIDAAVERRMMRAAGHVFAYTDSGSQAARAAGVEPTRVTTLRNAVDVESLRDQVADMRNRGMNPLGEKYGLDTSVPHFAYIGGLDSSKRIDLLAKTMEVLWEKSPSSRLLVGGAGTDLHLMRSAISRGQMVHLGRVAVQEKAELAVACAAILNPGRVGLLAVDALAMQLPIVAARGSFHGPEVEYLEEGRSWFLASDDPHSFSDEALSVAAMSPSLDWVGRSAPTIRGMTHHFVEGIRQMLGLVL